MATTAIIWLIVFITFCICIFLTWFFSHQATHRERIMMIEKGIHPDGHPVIQEKKRSILLKTGIVIIGLSIGLAIIAILSNFNLMGRSDATPVSILGICCGLALILANYVAKKSNK